MKTQLFVYNIGNLGNNSNYFSQTVSMIDDITKFVESDIFITTDYNKYIEYCINTHKKDYINRMKIFQFDFDLSSIKECILIIVADEDYLPGAYNLNYSLIKINNKLSKNIYNDMLNNHKMCYNHKLINYIHLFNNGFINTDLLCNLYDNTNATAIIVNIDTKITH